MALLLAIDHIPPFDGHEPWIATDSGKQVLTAGGGPCLGHLHFGNLR